MLGNPLYTGALILGAVVFGIYCYFTVESRQNFHFQEPQGRTDHYVRRTDDSLCAICQNTESGSFRNLRCGHSFHSSCIQRWSRSGSNTCPVCRRGF